MAIIQNGIYRVENVDGYRMMTDDRDMMIWSYLVKDVTKKVNICLQPHVLAIFLLLNYRL